MEGDGAEAGQPGLRPLLRCQLRLGRWKAETLMKSRHLWWLRLRLLLGMAGQWTSGCEAAIFD